MTTKKIIETFNNDGDLIKGEYLAAESDTIELTLVQAYPSDLLIKVGLSPLIGASKDQVKEAWKSLLNTRAFYFQEDGLSCVGGTILKPGFLSLRDLDSGEEILNATFKGSKCIDQTFLLNSYDYSDCLTEIRRLGFRSNSSRWTKPGVGYTWRIEPSGYKHLVMCRRLTSKRTTLDNFPTNENEGEN